MSVPDLSLSKEAGEQKKYRRGINLITLMAIFAVVFGLFLLAMNFLLMPSPAKLVCGFGFSLAGGIFLILNHVKGWNLYEVANEE